MNKRLLATAVCLLSSSLSFGASPLHTKFSDLHLDIGNRQIPHRGTNPAPVIDGTIGASEYTWNSGLVSYNNASSGTVANEGIDGYGDATISGNKTTPASADDLSFTLYMSHDAENVYLAVKIVDDVLSNNVGAPAANATSVNMWNNDCIEIAIDGDDTRNGRFTTTNATEDRGGLAGGRFFFSSSTEGGTGVADAQLGYQAARGYGATITLPDGSLGRYKGVVYAQSAYVPNKDTRSDIEYFMHMEGVGGNRSFELRIPKYGLSYHRTDKANPDPTHAGTFTNDVFGLQICVDDVDGTATVAEHQMFFENAAENLDGTDTVIGTDGNTWDTANPTLAQRATVDSATYSWDAVNSGILEANSYRWEAACPRFKLLPQASVQDWDKK